MHESIEKLKDKIIISCQASINDPLYNCMPAMIKTVINGQAQGLRLAGKEHINIAKKLTNVPIIGITKPDPLPENWKEVVYITPSFKEAELLKNADIIAIDGTNRIRPAENLAELISKIQKQLKKPVMADISTLEEGLNCSTLGADIISTTLSGYTKETLDKNNSEPDFELLKKLVNATKTPVILEGRIWTTEHIKTAFKLGAHAVVVGSAVTRPQLITQRFINYEKY